MLKKNIPERDIVKVWKIISGSISETICGIFDSRDVSRDKAYYKGIVCIARFGAVYLINAVWLNSGYDHRAVEEGRKQILKMLAGSTGAPEYEISKEYLDIAHEIAAQVVKEDITEIHGKLHAVSTLIFANAVSICDSNVIEEMGVLHEEKQAAKTMKEIELALKPLVELYEDEIDSLDNAENSAETIAFFCSNRAEKLNAMMSAGSNYQSERRAVYIEAVTMYMQEVTADVYNLVLELHPRSRDRFRMAAGEPALCGFDIEKKRLYRAGELYALYCYAVDREAADPYTCASLNSIQQEIINRAARVLRDWL